MILLILQKLFFKRSVLYLLLAVTVVACCSIPLQAQSGNQQLLPDTTAATSLTVTYSFAVVSAKKKGHAESYNGSIKTIFMQDGKVRSRLVALMRIQSLFYFQSATGKSDTIISIKETGRERLENRYTKEAWQQLNKKYNDATTELLNDSLQILNYNCKKAVVLLRDGKKITAYYTTAIRHPMFTLAEPAFVNIPGLVLHYQYETKDAVATYTATQVSTAPIDTQVFRLMPVK